MVADSLFVLNKRPPSFVSYTETTQFPAKVFLPLIHGLFASHYHPPACRPVQVLAAPSRIPFIVDPGSVLFLRSNTATVVKPWLISRSGGVIPAWYVASLEGEKMRGACNCSSLCPALYQNDPRGVTQVASQRGQVCIIPQPDGACCGLITCHVHVQLRQYSVVVRAAHESHLMTLKTVLLVILNDRVQCLPSFMCGEGDMIRQTLHL